MIQPIAQQELVREAQLKNRWAAILFSTLTLLAPATFADEPLRRIEVGLGARYMPTGSFQWSGRPGATRSDLGAYPALGAAPFVDYRLNRFVAIGLMPEITLNVIPRTDYYPVSAMIAASLRLKVEYPGLRALVPYVLFAPGYAWLVTYDNAGADSGDSHGLVVSAYGGLRIPVAIRHSVFAEAGYMQGFQKNGARDYAPSYLVLALGWQIAL